MKTIYLGMLKPEMMGVRPSRWFLMVNGEIHILFQPALSEMLSKLRENGEYEIVNITMSETNKLVKAELWQG
jgi:hypothetical protein